MPAAYFPAASPWRRDVREPESSAPKRRWREFQTPQVVAWQASGPMLLEQQLQGKLDVPRRIRRANGPERRVGGLRIGNSQVGVIQKIEELRAELHPDALAYP